MRKRRSAKPISFLAALPYKCTNFFSPDTLLNPEDGGSILYRSVGIHLSEYTASRPTIQ